MLSMKVTFFLRNSIINVLCGQNAEVLNVEAGGTRSGIEFTRVKLFSIYSMYPLVSFG
jgi:hypothetical protein